VIKYIREDEPIPGKQPKALAEFKDVNRYWDRLNQCYAAKIIPGEYYVSKEGELVTTVLGSCVSACVWDVKVKLGGMNHFMLPDAGSNNEWGSWNKTPVDAAARYGSVAMERLINTILKYGGRKENLEIKIFGGGRVLNIDSDVGERNIEFVENYAKKEGFTIKSRDVGGSHPRKVNFYPGDGRVYVKKLLRMHNPTVQLRERAYFREIYDQPVTGDVDVFVEKKPGVN